MRHAVAGSAFPSPAFTQPPAKVRKLPDCRVEKTMPERLLFRFGFGFIWGWFIVGLKSVKGWIKVHVEIDRWFGFD